MSWYVAQTGLTALLSLMSRSCQGGELKADAALPVLQVSSYPIGDVKVRNTRMGGLFQYGFGFSDNEVCKD